MVFGTGSSEVSIVIKAIDEFSTTMDSLSKNLKANTAGFIALTAAGAGITAIGVASLKVAADFEQSTIAFTTMLGSAEKADSFLRELADFAKRTPFTLKGIETASRKLLAVGFAAEDVIPVMTDVGNIASGLGLGQEGLDRLILNLGQVQAQGKLTGRELRDFAVAGIPLLDELANSLGKTSAEIQEMVSAGEITTKDVLAAFKKMGSAGGRFENLMEKQMKSAAGQFSNFQDSVELLQRELGKGLIPIANELLDIVIPLITEVAEWTKENSQLTKIIIIATTAVGGLLLFIGLVGLAIPPLVAGFTALGTAITFAGGPLGIIVGLLAGLAAVGLGSYIKELGDAASAYDTLGFVADNSAPKFRDLKDSIGWMEGGTRITETISDFETFNIELKDINGTIEVFLTNMSKLEDAIAPKETATPEQLQEFMDLSSRFRELQMKGQELPEDEMQKFMELRNLISGEPEQVGFFAGIKNALYSIFNAPESDLSKSKVSFEDLISKIREGNITSSSEIINIGQNVQQNVTRMTTDSISQIDSINNKLAEIPDEVITTHRIITVWG